MSRRSHENPDLYGEPVDDYAREQQAAYDDHYPPLDPPWWEDR